MHVIGHDDEITESIANSVEMVQCIGDNASDLRTSQDTRTVTIIKKTFVRLPELSLERVFEFLFQGVGNRFPVQRCGLGVACSMQPVDPFTIPSIDYYRGDGIGQSKGDEHDCSRLRPVRFAAFLNRELG